jgi:hypothetical protein
MIPLAWHYDWWCGEWHPDNATEAGEGLMVLAVFFAVLAVIAALSKIREDS